MRLKVLLRESHGRHKQYSDVVVKGHSLQQQQHNNFVRLHPNTAWALYNNVKTSSFDHAFEKSNNDSHPFSKNETTSSSISVPVVEFLPLALTCSSDDCATGLYDQPGRYDRGTLYVSYNGGIIPGESEIEIPSHLCELKNGNYVDVQSIQVKDAISVQLQPITTSDWELVDLHSQYLEEGGLLQQVSIVYPNQVLCLKLGTDSVRVKVLQECFFSNDNIPTEDESSYATSCSDSSDDDSLLSDSYRKKNSLSSLKKSMKTHVPVLDANYTSRHEYKSGCNLIGNEEDNIMSNYTNQCLRLVADTEVTVIPRPRSRDCPSMYPLSERLRIQPSVEDFTTAMKNLFAGDFSINTIPSPQHFSAYIHSKTLSSQVPGWNDLHTKRSSTVGNGFDSSSPKYAYAMMYKSSLVSRREDNNDCEYQSNQGVLIKLQELDGVPLGHIVIHRDMRYQQDLCPLLDFVQLQLMNDLLLENISQKLISCIEKNTVTFQINSVQTPVTNFQFLTSNSNESWKIPDSYGFHVTSMKSDVKDKSDHTACLKHIASSLSEFIRFHSDFGKGVPLYISSGSILPIITAKPQCNHGTIFCQITIKTKNQLNITGMPEEETPLVISVPDLLNSLILQMKGKCHNSSVSLENESFVQSNACNHISFRTPEKEFFINVLPNTLPHHGSLRNEINSAEKHLSISCKKDRNSHYKSIKFSEFNLGDIIITGETGCGKTHVALTIAAKLRIKFSMATIYFDARQLQVSSNLTLREILTELTASFHEAYSSRPSLLILDNLDVLTPNTDQGNDNKSGSVQHQSQFNPVLTAQVKSISDHINILLRELKMSCRDAELIVMCTSQRIDSLSSILKNKFLTHIKVPSLGQASRLIIFRSMLSNVRKLHLNGTCFQDFDTGECFSDFGKKTEGYRPKDLQVLATLVDDLIYSKKLTHSRKRVTADKSYIDEHFRVDLDLKECIDTALSSYTPLSLQTLDLVHQKITTSFSSIGGLFEAKKILSEIILRPVKYKILYRNSPIKLPTGILLFGPPGCGKTYLVPALARQCNFNLITCRGPELLDKYIGASEEKVRQLFLRAYAAAPSILFLDEFDALAPRRGMDNTGVTDRVVNQLLTFLDGVESFSEQKNSVYIVAATSRPDKIDPALLRPGRLEKHLYIGFPENEVEWIDLFNKVSLKMDLHEDVKGFIQSNDFLKFLRDNKTLIDSFSAADMNAIFDTANLDAVHEFLRKNVLFDEENKKQIKEKSTVLITKKQLLKSIVATKPSLSEKDRSMLNTIYAQYIKATPIKNQSKPIESFHTGVLKTALR